MTQRIIFVLLLGAAFRANTQVSVIPFQGFIVNNSGLSYETISMELEGLQWYSNRVPREKSFKIIVNKPRHFKEEESGKIFPGISILFMQGNGDTLGYAANIFGDDFAGMEPEFTNNLSVTLGFNDQVNPGDMVWAQIVFFDTRSSRKLQLEGAIVIQEDDAPLDQTDNTYRYRSFKGITGEATGVELKRMESEIDTVTRPGQKALLVSWDTDGQYALDLRGAHRELMLVYTDGTVRNDLNYGEYTMDFKTEDPENPQRVKTTMRLWINPEEQETIEAIWLRLDGTKGTWTLTGSASF